MKASITCGTILIVASLAGCATEPVSELADKTAANVAIISAHLRQLDANSQGIAQQRADTVSRLRTANAELRARYSYDVALTRKTGGGSNLDLLDDIEAWREEVEAIFDVANTVEAARREAVLSTQTKLNTKTKALAEIAQSLAALAQDERQGDRVRFLAGYAVGLRTELASALQEDSDTARAALALLEETGVTLTAGNAPAASGESGESGESGDNQPE